MGLDASVACNCFERGITKPSPPGLEIQMAPEGFWDIRDGASTKQRYDFIEWSLTCCDHPGQVRLEHRLGHLGNILFIRSWFNGTIDHLDLSAPTAEYWSPVNENPAEFPILLEKVLFSGIHGGDWLIVEDVQSLGAELDLAVTRLQKDKLPEMEHSIIAEFLQNMRELRQAAISMNKPILF